MSDLPLVLIVDDNDGTGSSLAMCSARRVPDVEAATAAEGIALASDHLPDVILMDLRLPDIDGTEAARMLRAEPRTSRIPVVALTALPLDAREDGSSTPGLPATSSSQSTSMRFPTWFEGSARAARTAPPAAPMGLRRGASIPPHMQAGTVGTRSTSPYVGEAAETRRRNEMVTKGIPMKRKT